MTAALTEMGRVGSRGRIATIDLARTAAIFGMVVYHFTFDLSLFGHVPASLPVTGFWAVLARAVAGSFLFLAGVSLWLAHGHGITWPAFLRRFGILVAAAALITVATWLTVHDAFIFFGILHSIAACSLLGLAFLRLPSGIVLLTAAVVLILPQVFRADLFNTPLLIWTGLGTLMPRTLDFEPVFPWFALFLAGLGLAQIADGMGLLKGANQPPGRAMRLLAWPGRHSLVIYLLHQPVMIALVWAATQMMR